MNKFKRRLLTIIMIATPCSALLAGHGGDAAVGALGGAMFGTLLGTAMSQSSSSSSNAGISELASQNRRDIHTLDGELWKLKNATIPGLEQDNKRLRGEIESMKADFDKALSKLQEQINKLKSKLATN